MALITDWHFFFGEYEEGPAVIGFYRDIEGAMPGRPWLHWLRMEMISPAENGIFDESSESNALDLKMEEHFLKHFDAVLVGRIGHGGYRTFYYYAPAREGFDKQCDSLLGAKYEFKTGSELDPDWTIYKHDLCPSELESWCMSAMEMSNSMEEKLDQIAIPRRIDHWIYFQNGTMRDKFIERVQVGKFMVDETWFNDDYESEEYPGIEGFPYGLQIYRDDAAEYPHLREIITDLYNLTQEHDGYYDGLEAFPVWPEKRKKAVQK